MVDLARGPSCLGQVDTESDVVYAWKIMVTPVGGKMSTENTESTEDICCPALYEN